MAFQVSPGVLVKEIDATNVVPAVSTSDAGFAAAFLWGPADQITSITSEVELAKVFGKPTTTAVEQNWHVASNFLAYAGSLNVVRTLGDDETNASDGSGTAVEGVISDLEGSVTSGGTGHTAGTKATTAGTGVGTGATVLITVDGSGVILTASIVAGGSGYASGDILNITGGTGGTATVDTVTTTTAVGEESKVENTDKFDSTTYADGGATFIARYAGALGNSLLVSVWHQGTFTNWKETINGTDKDLYTLYDRAPNTSAYVLGKNGNTDVNDEIHLVVIDADGKLTGTAGTVLEKYEALSLADDARDAQGNSNFWKDVLRRDSQYIYGTGFWANATSEASWSNHASSDATAFTNLTTGYSVQLANGVDDTADGNSTTNRTVAGKGYNLFDDADTVDIGILMTGVDDSAAAVGEYIIENVAEVRKDCIVTLSPQSSAVIGAGTSASKTATVKTWAESLRSSSYGIADSGWKRTYNRYTDKYIDIPLNGDVAGLCVATDNSNASWWSPAGFSRGQIKNVVKLWLNPAKADRDTLYKDRVNPVVSMPGQGTLLFGDKTLLAKPSAFDRINVRRLFIVLEKSISRAAKSMLFEFNDEFTRSSFRNMVEPFLGGIKAQRGIFDYKVVCDTSNNTGDVIDRNEFVGDIFVKPARSINFIQLNFVAVRTGVAFSEVAGA
ncbi:hypothetical protein CMI47_13585 [Candidatus Pacearchaeota archaeon]|jgi:hypothetical protein|nr:hypothetical protein [Candidatus Pacearchaeota archaeon]